MAALDAVEAQARRAVAASLADLGPGDRVLVGVSGGSDSLALAAVSSWVARKLGYSLSALVVDHGLQKGSDDVAERALAQVRWLGISAEIAQVQVGTAGGPEAAARTARMAALQLRGAKAVLLGHTLDDQAETVLLGLGRGSGPRSISGMSVKSGTIRRPFLGLTRADTQHLCHLHELTWWDDPHNSDPAFRRSRLRTEVMPLLDDVLGSGVVRALGRTRRPAPRRRRPARQDGSERGHRQGRRAGGIAPRAAQSRAAFGCAGCRRQARRTDRPAHQRARPPGHRLQRPATHRTTWPRVVSAGSTVGLVFGPTP